MAAYWMLYTSEGGAPFAPQFGSHDRSDVVSEKEDAKDNAWRHAEPLVTRIVRFSDCPAQAEINAKCEELNKR